MGLAFDIALVNTPLETVYEIRDVLRAMRDAGDLLFIGERRQLVFHVVPHPARLGHFHDVYVNALGTPAAAQAAQVIASSPSPLVRAVHQGPWVEAEVIAVQPIDLPWPTSRIDDTHAEAAAPVRGAVDAASSGRHWPVSGVSLAFLSLAAIAVACSANRAVPEPLFRR
jgi:hypothetical protein